MSTSSSSRLQRWRTLATVAFALGVLACGTDGSGTIAAPEPDFARPPGAPGGGGGNGGGGGGSSSTDALVASFDDARPGVTSDPRDADGDGVSDPYEDGVDQVRTVITDAGQFQLHANDGGSPAIRLVSIEVVDARPGTGTILVAGGVEARIQTKRVSDPGGLDLRAMAVGEQALTAIRVLWDDGDLSWRLRFGRVCKEPGAADTPVPEQRISVTRTAADSWAITSLVDGVERMGRLCLLDRSVRKKDQQVVTVSDHVVAPFTITATVR